MPRNRHQNKLSKKTSALKPVPFMLAILVALLSIISSGIVQASAATASSSQVLVQINNLTVTDKDLEEALRSSPFYTQFNAMNEQEQGSLRGNILKRLVTSRLFSLEAEEKNLENDPAFIKELDNFRKGLLYRYYMDSLRNRIKIPEKKLAEFKKASAGNRDAITAAKASYINSQYKGLYKLTIKNLRDKYHVVLHEDKVSLDATSDTVLLEGDAGKDIVVTLADVYDVSKKDDIKTKDQLLEKIYELAELLVVSKAAEDEGVDISEKVAGYKKERLPALFVENLQKDWTKNEDDLNAYYKAHPEIAIIPQRWHLGMLVLNTEEQANDALARIKNGESLFKLAGEISIDPYGKKHLGDMGWVKEHSGNPVIENAIKDLPDGKISGIIKTEKGYIIATILDRRPGGVRRFEAMKDKMRQLLINEKMHTYLSQLEKKYKVDWKLLKPTPSIPAKPIDPIKEANNK